MVFDEFFGLQVQVLNWNAGRYNNNSMNLFTGPRYKIEGKGAPSFAGGVFKDQGRMARCKREIEGSTPGEKSLAFSNQFGKVITPLEVSITQAKQRLEKKGGRSRKTKNVLSQHPLP